MKNKPFDSNKILTRLIEGERTYSDGRHSFWYENLLHALKAANIEIDQNAIYDASCKRYAVSGKRRELLQARRVKVYPYIFEFNGSADKHFDLIWERDYDGSLPMGATYEAKFADNGELDKYVYKVYGRQEAAVLWRWIKKFHPDYTNLRITRNS